MRPPHRLRRLTDDEIALWRAVAQTVDARPGSSLPDVPEPPAAPAAPPPKPVPDRRTTPAFLPAFTPSPPPRPPVPPLAALDRRYKQRVARGRVDIERVIDLHGLSQAEAHAALRGFLRSAHLGDARLVLVVTGKGVRSRASQDPQRETGVLRRAVPQWLREADLRPIVLGFEEASLPHGGAGALYIRLRRRKGPG